jgi:hypothetical protein
MENKIKDIKQEYKLAKSRSVKKFQGKQKYVKKIQNVTSTIDRLKTNLTKTEVALGKLKTQKVIASENRTWNLTTSQKSYIDPRVYHQWGIKVNYDVLEKYYSKTLQRKFLWVRNNGDQVADE